MAARLAMKSRARPRSLPRRCFKVMLEATLTVQVEKQARGDGGDGGVVAG